MPDMPESNVSAPHKVIKCKRCDAEIARGFLPEVYIGAKVFYYEEVEKVHICGQRNKVPNLYKTASDALARARKLERDTQMLLDVPKTRPN